MLERISVAVNRVVPRIPRRLVEDRRMVLTYFINNPGNPWLPEYVARVLNLERDEVFNAMVELAEQGLLDVSGRHVMAWRPSRA